MTLYISAIDHTRWRAKESTLHNDGDEDRGTKALQQDIGEGLKDRIGDKEDGERRIVFACAHIM
jgi:hypothetical protein